MVAASFAPNATGCIIFLVIAVGLGGFAWSGFRYLFAIFSIFGIHEIMF